MNNTQFSNSFKFREYRFKKSYRYTDARTGAEQHYIACMRKGRCRIVSEEGTIEVSQGEVFYVPKKICGTSLTGMEKMLSVLILLAFIFFRTRKKEFIPCR